MPVTVEQKTSQPHRFAYKPQCRVYTTHYTMRWSKIRSEIEDRFFERIRGRISIHITSYGRGHDVKDLYNRGWITVYGHEIVDFSTPDSLFLTGSDYNSPTPISGIHTEEKSLPERTPIKFSEKGVLSMYDLSQCCHAYLDKSITEALNHESPIIKTLSILDNQVGKRRLLKLGEDSMYPPVKYFYRLRLEVEHIRNNSN